MESIITHQERRNSNRGKTISVVVHIALILLALLPLLHYPTPPPGQEGILVNLGLPDMGEGDDNAGPTTPAEPEVEEEEAPEVEEEEALPEPEPEEVEPEPVPDKEVVKTEDAREIALKREKEAERKKQEEADRKKKAEADAKKRAEAEAKRKAEADAKRKAEAEARQKAEADKLKSDIGGLFGDGGGKGNTGKPGNQGDPNGDPNASNLEGISTGSGKVGGGLGGRGVLKSPRVTENSQKAGTVVVSVCVDANGKVLSAEYTQRGSTTGDSQLVKAAIRNAKLWGFSKGSVDKQCGTISYNFKVK